MHHFRFAALAVVAVFGFASVASATDMSVKASVAAPIAAPVYSWTGFYGGLNAGGGWENTTINNNSTSIACLNNLLPAICNLISALVPTQFDTHPQGFIGGGQLGYNSQIRSFVLGVETDFQGSAIKGSETVSNAGFLVFPFTVAGTGSQKIDWFGTLRGRLGWLPTDALLIYATGGLAYGHVRTEASFLGNGAGFSSVFVGSTTLSQSDTRAGWTVGGGLEWMFAPRWSVKAEYLYYDLGTVTLNQTLSVVDITIGGVATSAIQSEAHYRGNIARVGVNYHF